jgi:heme/copper-type cytochrome/quinol oxidase subunit 4
MAEENTNDNRKNKLIIKAIIGVIIIFLLCGLAVYYYKKIDTDNSTRGLVKTFIVFIQLLITLFGILYINKYEYNKVFDKFIIFFIIIAYILIFFNNELSDKLIIVPCVLINVILYYGINGKL